MEIYGLSQSLLTVTVTVLYSLQLVHGQDSPCDPNPCKNGGVCFPQPDNFFCLCVLGYLGKTCDGLPGDATTANSQAADLTTAHVTTIAGATTMDTTSSTRQMTTGRSTQQMTTGLTTTATASKQSSEALSTTPWQTSQSSDPSSSTQLPAEGSSSMQTDSSGGGGGVGGMATSSNMLVGAGDTTTPDEKTVKSGPLDNDTVKDNDDTTFLWLLFLILFAMLIIAAIITLIAVKRATKQHGKYDPSAALANENSPDGANGGAEVIGAYHGSGSINPGHSDDVV